MSKPVPSDFASEADAAAWFQTADLSSYELSAARGVTTGDSVLLIVEESFLERPLTTHGATGSGRLELVGS